RAPRHAARPLREYERVGERRLLLVRGWDEGIRLDRAGRLGQLPRLRAPRRPPLAPEVETRKPKLETRSLLLAAVCDRRARVSPTSALPSTEASRGPL